MNQEQLINVLLEPRITEKSTMIGDKHKQFVFKVARQASKPEIKRAVEIMFEVEVESIQVCNVRGKRKVIGQRSGHRTGWKKAYVKLKPGFDIDFMGAQ